MPPQLFEKYSKKGKDEERGRQGGQLLSSAGDAPALSLTWQQFLAVLSLEARSTLRSLRGRGEAEKGV